MSGRIHMTPTEIAREHDLERREVIALCRETDVPVFQGRIDRKLFADAYSEWKRNEEQRQKDQIEDDMRIHGVAFLLDGKRVDPRRVTAIPHDQEPADEPT